MSSSEAEQLAALQAQLAEAEAKLARATQPPKPQPRKTRGSLSRKAKAEALVAWGISDSMRDAYAYLEDMGE